MLLEPDEQDGANPYLADFYADPAKFAFTMQVHLLGRRYAAHELAQWHVLTGRGDAVLDSSYFSDTCFAKMQRDSGAMSVREYETYCQLFKAMTCHVTFPSVCIFLHVTPETAQRRIKQRMEERSGRKCESVVDCAYLSALEENILNMMNVLQSCGTELIWVNWEQDRPTLADRAQEVERVASIIRGLPVRGAGNLFTSYAKLL